MKASAICAFAMLLVIGPPIASATNNGNAQGGRSRCGDNDRFFSGFSQLEVVGLTADQRLVCFNELLPVFARTIGAVDGLEGDTKLVGIDFRPATGELYGLGDAGGVYTIDLDDATATFKSQLNMSLSGMSFGVDFNPTVDLMRVISDNGQNLRVNVDTGATMPDTNLNYPAPTPTPGVGITGAAYTNNDNSADTGTTLFDIDTTRDQVVVQAPPNAGQLFPTGKLLVDAATTDVGFDIFSTIREGRTSDNKAFASLVTNGKSRFYRIDLLTGRANLRGSFSSKNVVTDIAVPPNQ